MPVPSESDQNDQQSSIPSTASQQDCPADSHPLTKTVDDTQGSNTVCIRDFAYLGGDTSPSRSAPTIQLSTKTGEDSATSANPSSSNVLTSAKTNASQAKDSARKPQKLAYTRYYNPAWTESSTSSLMSIQLTSAHLPSVLSPAQPSLIGNAQPLAIPPVREDGSSYEGGNRPLTPGTGVETSGTTHPRHQSHTSSSTGSSRAFSQYSTMA